jgi:uncharacterized membrane protein
MSALDTAMYAVHLLVAGVWTGSVVFTTYAVVPTAADGTANAEPLAAIVSRLRTVSRAGAVLLLLTGGYMAGQGYTVDSLTGSTRGYLVLGMVVLWLLLAAFVEVGAGKLASGFDDMKVREPAREARPFMLAATLVALLLLVEGGILAAGFGGAA